MEESNPMYNMKQHDILFPSEASFEIIRVPGGWIYTRMCEDNATSCFVPFDNEFQ